MVSDGVIHLRAMAPDELARAHAMSDAPDARDFIVPGTLERFRDDFARPEIRFLSIVEIEPERGGKDGLMDGPAGYFILALEPDGVAVECRRIVVGRKNRGIGRRAMALLDRYCREVLERRRIWLDVYDFNSRGQRVYESSGYHRTGRGERDGKVLLFYEKLL